MLQKKMTRDLQKKLLLEGNFIDVKEWQSININQEMYEICNINIEFNCPNTINKLEKITIPNLPWAENHFQERINGKPLNPGVQWENWPYYYKSKDDKRFRSNKGILFDHTYMERFWPEKKEGIRYKMGDLNDIIERLKNNLFNRQSFLSIWHPEDQSNDKSNKRIPCTLGYYFQCRNNKLNVNYFIRSCDAIRHLNNDLYMTGRLLQYVAEKIGQNIKVGKIYVWIGNLHCFKTDLQYLKKITK
jgi:thymidylate synthase